MMMTINNRVTATVEPGVPHAGRLAVLFFK